MRSRKNGSRSKALADELIAELGTWGDEAKRKPLVTELVRIRGDLRMKSAWLWLDKLEAGHPGFARHYLVYAAGLKEDWLRHNRVRRSSRKTRITAVHKKIRAAASAIDKNQAEILFWNGEPVSGPALLEDLRRTFKLDGGREALMELASGSKESNLSLALPKLLSALNTLASLTDPGREPEIARIAPYKVGSAETAEGIYYIRHLTHHVCRLTGKRANPLVAETASVLTGRDIDVPTARRRGDELEGSAT